MNSSPRGRSGCSTGSPSAVATSFTGDGSSTERLRPRWDGWDEARKAQERAKHPLRRVAEARDQARVICFLASADADFVTGVTIDVTGGI